MLSVVIPAYNEEAAVEKTAAVIHGILASHEIPYEMIFIDDGSSDGTWEAVSRTARDGSSVRGIRFSRNFGKEAAIIAGLTEAAGDCAVVIDCDLQHPPEKIAEMYALWQQGYEIVEARKTNRGREGMIHALGSRIFYAVISRAMGMDMRNTSDFKLLDRRAVDVLINMRERNSFFRALSSWIGFRTAAVYFDVRERETGSSSWSGWALTKYAVHNITSFSAAPMQLVTLLGGIMLIWAMVFGGIALVQKLEGRALEGFTTVILLLLFSSSIIMMSLGIIGFYIARIYEEIKGRPRYVIRDHC